MDKIGTMDSKRLANELVREWVRAEDSTIWALEERIAQELSSVDRDARIDGIGRALAWCGVSLSETQRCIEETADFQHRIDDEMLEKLSARQREVCALIYSGKNYEEVSELLGITQSTARNHARGACLKLGCTSVDSMIKATKRSEKLF